MEMPVHLSAKGVELAPEQEALAREAVAKLERFFDRLVGCRVVVSVPHRHTRGEPIAWTVRLSLTVPGAELVVTRRTRPSFREALDAAFDAARRRLQDYAREVRGDVKQPAAGLRGRVTRLLNYEGYGFIRDASGREVYFHRNSVPDDGFDRLAVGAPVRWVESAGAEGPQASTVVPVGRSARAGFR